METKRLYNEVYDSTGRLIILTVVDITTYDDGQVVENIISVQTY